MNTLFVLLDGAEDQPIPKFGGKKPMDVADMPFMDSRVKFKGTTDGKGYTHIFLNEFFTGHPPEIPRAAIEALGLGMDMKDRTAYRLSPAIIRNGMIEWSYHAKEFCDRLVPKVMEHLSYVEEYDPEINFFLHGRAILTLKNDFDMELPSPPVPAPYVRVPGKLGDMVEAIAKDLDGITDYPWGCGKAGKQYPPLIEKMAAVSDVPTPLGICASVGYEIRTIRDFEERFRFAKEKLEDCDVFLHVDEIDEHSHERDPDKKVRTLEKTDELMCKYFSDTERIVYIVDHGTSSLTGEHLIMDVPFWTTFDVPGCKKHIPADEIIKSISK